MSDSAELWDPRDGKFHPAGHLGTRRYDHSATRLPSGKVLITGGRHKNYALKDWWTTFPIDAVEGDTNGLRLGTPEAVRWGMRAADMDTLAEFITRGLSGDDSVGTDVTQWRSVFNKVHFTAR